MRVESIPFVAIPIGWMKCVACSDFRTQPGKMHLGYSHGEDMVITCPQCKGTGQVERYQHIDVRTGREIDYEKPGQKFEYLGQEPKGH